MPAENLPPSGFEATDREPTVLVVDDVPVDRRKAGGLIEQTLGWKVTYAGNGLSALASMANQLPNLVLTDLQMPEMDGLELVETIRRRYPLVPVVLMTAHGSEEIALQALQRGAASYVSKKGLVRSLPSTLEQVLNAATQVRHRQRLLGGMVRMESDFLLENDQDLIPTLVDLLQESLVGMMLCDDNERMRVGIALEEALVNACYHGNLELSSELLQKNDDAFHRLAHERSRLAPYKDRNIHMTAKLTRREVVYVITDEGPGFDPAKLPDPTDPANLEKSSGRGLLLIRAFMDEVRHNETGNEITLIKRRQRTNGAVSV